MEGALFGSSTAVQDSEEHLPNKATILRPSHCLLTHGSSLALNFTARHVLSSLLYVELGIGSRL